MRGSLVRALRTKVSDARACVQSVLISSSSRFSSSSVSQTARRRRNPIERVRPFVESELDASVRSRHPYTHPRLDSTRVSARSDDACVTILHFRAVIDGVDASRRTLDLDASSGRSFIHALIHSFTQSFTQSFIHVARLVDRARDSFPRMRDSPSRVPAPR